MMKRAEILIVLILSAVVGQGCNSLSKKGGNRNSADNGIQKQVVIYVSEDQVFSEPILKDFETATGISVKAVYDTEESKSTGVMNRLIAEQHNPQADVYWANEPLRAELLRQRGITQPYRSPQAKGIQEAFKEINGHWTGFSARARVLLARRGLQRKPSSILDYTRPQWKGKAAIANPLFGTTTVQVAALFTLWGETPARIFLDELKKNQIKMTGSNGESADLVGSGEVDFALVDSDDAVNRLKQGKEVEMIFPDQAADGIGCLILPNAVLMIQGAFHGEAARKLIDYLLSPETEQKLAFADCAQIPLHPGVKVPPEVPKIETIRVMRFSHVQMAQKMQEIQPILKSWAGL